MHRYNINCINVVAVKTIQTTADFYDYFLGIPDRIRAKADETWVKTQEMSIGETKMALEYFRPYLLSIGPMIWKKEKRLEELDRGARNLQFTIEMCNETLDPNAKKYEQQANELIFQKGAIERKIEKLRARADKACEDFEPIEEEYKEMGFVFDHPKLAMVEEMVEGVTRVLHRKRRQVESEQYHVDVDDDDIQTQTTTLKQAKERKQVKMLPALAKTPKGQQKGNLMFD